MTESSRASSTSIQIFLKTDIFFSPFSKKKTNKPTNSRPHKNVKQRNIIASLTEHALYDVWHHCIRKPLFSSVHTNDKPAIQKKAPLWGTFSKTWVSDAWKPCSRVDKMLKRRKKSPFSYIFGYVSTGPKFLTKYLILLCGFIIKRGGGGLGHSDQLRSSFAFFLLFPSKGGRVTLRLAAGEIPKSDNT